MHAAPAFSPDGPILVLGYGSTLRCDDAAGPLVAERILRRAYAGVQAVAAAQLSPEHAPLVAAAGEVVFVDAVPGSGRRVRLEPVGAAASARVTSHALEPGTLLALARDLYGRLPPAWLLPVPARDLAFGQRLSPATEAAVAEAVGILDKFIQLRLALRAARAGEPSARPPQARRKTNR